MISVVKYLTNIRKKQYGNYWNEKNNQGREARAFGSYWEIKNPLGNPADFPGERKGGKMHLLPFAKYIIGKQGVKLKWKIHLKIHFRIA